MGTTLRGLSGWARLGIYAAALLVGVLVTFYVGMEREGAVCDRPDFDGECDVAGLVGLVWGGAAFLVLVTTFVAIEVVRDLRKRARNGEGR
ncbi:hypothetical protein [Nocardioides daejeonensis]|uniref:hypothetical protein n=1 Tax=Nocardioides daejeonensis TaxID=1046556 RepID=UPI0013A58D3C|nr:hypothetical protein [Nocardioides daejeonensis]